MSDIINIITMMETLFTPLLMEKVLDLLESFLSYLEMNLLIALI